MDLSLELQTACPLGCGKVTWRSLKPPSHLFSLLLTDGSGDERWSILRCLSPLGIVTHKKALPFLGKLVDLSFCYQRVLTASEQKAIMEE